MGPNQVSTVGPIRLDTTTGVFSRKITVRQTGDQVDERGGYVRLVTQVNGAWKYRALSVVVLPPSG